MVRALQRAGQDQVGRRSGRAWHAAGDSRGHLRLDDPLVARRRWFRGGAGRAALAVELANQGNTVFVLVPRGLPAQEDPRRFSFSGDWLPNVRAWLIGRNLPAMRAHDILNAVQILVGRDDVDPAQIRAEASGV